VGVDTTGGHLETQLIKSAASVVPGLRLRRDVLSVTVGLQMIISPGSCHNRPTPLACSLVS